MTIYEVLSRVYLNFCVDKRGRDIFIGQRITLDVTITYTEAHTDMNDVSNHIINDPSKLLVINDVVCRKTVSDN